MAEHESPSLESVHSQAVRAHISHAVIATYAADAAVEVEGVHALVGGRVGSLTGAPSRSGRPRRCASRAAPAAPWRSDRPGRHVGFVDPRGRRRVSSAVGAYLESMVDLPVAEVTVFVDGVAVPDAA